MVAVSCTAGFVSITALIAAGLSSFLTSEMRRARFV